MPEQDDPLGMSSQALLDYVSKRERERKIAIPLMITFSVGPPIDCSSSKLLLTS
jgi:hypothetical protein